MTATLTQARTADNRDGKLTQAGYALLQRYIYGESGIVIDIDRQYFFESRLLPLLTLSLVRDLNVSSLDALAERLSKGNSPALGELVIDAVTTNETFFFRDERMFEALRTHILPTMLENVKAGRKLRIWSAAAASGQEAYSIAMLLRDMGRNALDVEIIGTDISSKILTRARNGRYGRCEVGRGVSQTHLANYFVQVGSEWQIRDEVRSMVRFEQMDLRRNVGRLGIFDIILCRNVLIYFDNDTRRKIMGAIRPMLGRNGVFVLGCAETIINVSESFERRHIGQSTFYCG
jgi:chemotaxis protein methyltransferase CheR